MTSISIIGAGNMGMAIASIAARGGSPVQLIARAAEKATSAATTAGETVTPAVVGDVITGDIVVFAVPHPAISAVLAEYGPQLDGKVIVDITNPLDFSTFDSLAVPADSSSAQEIATVVPGATVLKAFNTTFAATLAAGEVRGVPTTVLIAGDDQGAKDALAAIIQAGGIGAIDAGALKRARELEAIGFLQLTLAIGGKLGWTGGFAVAA